MRATSFTAVEWIRKRKAEQIELVGGGGVGVRSKTIPSREKVEVVVDIHLFQLTGIGESDETIMRVFTPKEVVDAVAARPLSVLSGLIGPSKSRQFLWRYGGEHHHTYQNSWDDRIIATEVNIGILKQRLEIEKSNISLRAFVFVICPLVNVLQTP